MKTVAQLHEILRKHDFRKVDLHIHTHLCDGEPDMTVENIANQAMEKGLTCIVLQPHFHKQVSDETATLYTDTDEDFYVDTKDDWDINDRVGIKIEPKNLNIEKFIEVDEEETEEE